MKNNLLFYPIRGIVAFSTTRHGGCSKGHYASFNCTPYTGDVPECVAENRETLLQQLPQRPHELIIPYQTHSTNILTVDETYRKATANQRWEMLQAVDALITSESGFCLCISTADCIPLLLYDKTHHAIAAIHAGWRGTVARIVTHTLYRMHRLYGTCGKDIEAVIAPGISLAAFEVGDEVYHAFHNNGFPMERISEFYPSAHKYHIDLPAANSFLLQDFGVPASQIRQSGICTYTQHQDFFSARRIGIKSGRMLSGVMLA